MYTVCQCDRKSQVTVVRFRNTGLWLVMSCVGDPHPNQEKFVDTERILIKLQTKGCFQVINQTSTTL